MPNTASDWQLFGQLSAAELYELLRFRQHIFVVEQRSPYPDLDGLDHDAWHLSLRAEGGLAGYLRLVPASDPPPTMRIGRVAVAAALRRRGLGGSLMREALRFCGAHYPASDIALSAQTHQVPFYQHFGFVIASDPYDDFGVLHVDMRLNAGDVGSWADCPRREC